MLQISESQLQEQAGTHQAEVSLIERTVAELTVNSDVTMTTAVDYLSYIAAKKKEVEATRTSITKPINDGLKTINAFFKRVSDPLDKADKLLRDKVKDYRKEQERVKREQEELLRKQMEEASAGEEIPFLPAVEGPAKSVGTDMGTMSGRNKWKFEIEDETKIPRSYLTVDEKAIRAAVKAGTRSIPGVRIYEDEVLTVRAR